MGKSEKDNLIRLINERADYDNLVCHFRKEHPYIEPTRKNLLRFVKGKKPIPTDAAGEEIGD